MSKFSIRNITAGGMTLPPPYGAILPPGKSVVVEDTEATILANLGGPEAVLGVLRIEAVAESAIVSTLPTPTSPLFAESTIRIDLQPGETFQEIVRRIPNPPPPGVTVDVNVTGLGQEILPDGFELPAFKAPRARQFDFENQFFPLRAAINISADPQIVEALGANATIVEADLVSTLIGGGIADIVPNPVGQSGIGDEIVFPSTQGPGIAEIKPAAGVYGDQRAKTVTIAGSANPANDGTFPITFVGSTTIAYVNPAAVAEGPGGLFTWETYFYEEPVIEVETTTPHGLWIQTEQPSSGVTVAGVLEGAGEIGDVANGTHLVLWVSPTKFAIFVDGTGLTYGGGGTVSVIFVQDPASGLMEVKTTKNFGADDSLVGKLVVETGNPFGQSVVYHNTIDTLVLTRSFVPLPLSPEFQLQIMEQSAELITSVSVFGRRGGFNVMNCDSIALNGLKITPANPDEIGLYQLGGNLLLQGCALTKSVHQSPAHDVYVGYSDVVNSFTQAWQVHDRSLHRGGETELQLFTGQRLDASESVYMDMFGIFASSDTQVILSKFLRTEFGFIFFEGEIDIGGVAFEDTANFPIGILGQARFDIGTFTTNALAGATVLAVDQGGVALVNSIQAAVTPDHMMFVGQLPPRSFADFFTAVGGPLATYTDITAIDPVTGATGRGGSILDH